MSGKIIFFLLIFLSTALAIRAVNYFDSQEKYTSGDKISLTTTLLEEPKVLAFGQQLSIRLDSGQSLFLIAPLIPKLSYGDEVNISGVVEEVKINESLSNSSEKSFLALKYPQVSVKSQAQNPLLAVASSLRYKISTFYNQNLPPTSAALLLGIVFGIKENVPSDFSAALRNSGVTHVIAASGMNISLLAGFFVFLFMAFLKRKLAIIATMIIICFYTILSGLEPSILRAAIMGIFAFSAQIIGRQSNSIFALILTAFIMLFISPMLIFDVGFQLSFLATLGILTLNPTLDAHFSKSRPLKAIKGDLSTTTSAQIFTVPIIILTFGTYSLISIIANLLVLWTVPILMVLGAIAALLGLVFTPLGVLVLYLSYPFLIYFEWVVKTLGSTNLLFKAQGVPVEILIGYYLLLLAFLVKIKKR